MVRTAAEIRLIRSIIKGRRARAMDRLILAASAALAVAWFTAW